MGSGQSGSIKRLRVGAEAAEANLRAVLKEAFAQAGVKGVKAACCGVASATMPGITEWITAVFDDFGVERSEVVGDEVIALDAAFQGGPGILQIAGTGSNCVGRAPDGTLETAGGWSSRLGDEGSGYWIGVNSIRRALHAYDREEPCQVIPKVMEIWGTPTTWTSSSISAMARRARILPRWRRLSTNWPKRATRSPWAVLQQAAIDLVEFVLLVRSKLRRKHGITGEVPVAWTGSVIAKMESGAQPVLRRAARRRAGNAGWKRRSSRAQRRNLARRAHGQRRAAKRRSLVAALRCTLFTTLVHLSTWSLLHRYFRSTPSTRP